jgi:hypothetical protein
MKKEYDEFWMIKDIIDAGTYTDENKKTMRLCYFRGLSHSKNKEKIIRESFEHARKCLKM